MCVARPHTHVFVKKIPEKLNFINKKKCAVSGERAGAKNGLRVRAPHITIFVRYARAGAAQKVSTLKVWAKFKLKLTAE